MLLLGLLLLVHAIHLLLSELLVRHVHILLLLLGCQIVCIITELVHLLEITLPACKLLLQVVILYSSLLVTSVNFFLQLS